MAQSNYNIPNESAPAVRAQLNAVFQSIATNNSGSSAPSTTFPHQWWYDTANNILRQRNAADSAWIDIGTFDQGSGTFVASVTQLSQNQVEDDTSTVFGTVSGRRLFQAISNREWELLEDRAVNPNVGAGGAVTWSGLDDYRDITVGIVAVESDGGSGSRRMLRVGSSGDIFDDDIYQQVAGAPISQVRLHANSGNGPRSATCTIYGFNRNEIKRVENHHINDDSKIVCILKEEPMDRIRIFCSSGQPIKNGRFYIWGRKG